MKSLQMQASNIAQQCIADLKDQLCLRDQLIDDLVRQVDIWKEVAIAEINMSEVLSKELAKVLEKQEKL